jgi:hypothetical protein
MVSNTLTIQPFPGYLVFSIINNPAVMAGISLIEYPLNSTTLVCYTIENVNGQY